MAASFHRHGSRVGARVLAAAGAVAAAAAAVHAQPTPSDPFIRIHATGGGLDGWLNVSLAQATVLPDGYSFTLATNTSIVDTATSQVIADLSSLQSSVRTLPSGVQALALSFVVTNGPADANFSFSSTLASFPILFPAEGRATASIGTTDQDGNGATLTFLQPGGFAYLAEYNGQGVAAPDFALLLGGGTMVAGPLLSNTSVQNEPAAPGAFTPIPVGVTAMHAQYDFRLTANDSASGSSNFFVRVPAPSAAVALVGFGLVAGGRRRR